MTHELTGSCQCGAVKYHTLAAPAFAVHCYCRQCQRVTGAGHASQFAIPTAEVTIIGKLAEYILKSDSGNAVTSAFCPVCGSPVYKQSAGYSQFFFFHAATLDDPSQFKPQQSVWTSQKSAWDIIDESLAQTL